MKEDIEELLKKSKELRARKDTAAKQYAEEALAMADKLGDVDLQLKARLQILLHYLSIEPNFDITEVMALEMLSYPEIKNDVYVFTTARNILGISYDIKGKYMDSRNCYLDNITLLESCADLNKENLSTLGNAYHNLSKLYQQVETGSLEKFQYIDKGIAAFEKAEDYNGLARMWNLKASFLPDDTPIQERLTLFQKALSYFDKGEELLGYTLCQSNIGLCYCHLGKYDEGIALLYNSLERVRGIKAPPHISFTLFQLGEALRMKGDHEGAIKHLEEAEKVLIESNGKVYLNTIYQEWATNLAALGRFEEAYEKMQKFLLEVEDRLHFDRQSAEAEARLKFELEKKEKESEQMRKRTEEIELYNEKLRQSNDELNQFAYVASHDLKEPLRMVSNYIQLLEKSLKGNLDDDQTAYVRYVNEGAKRMYKLIDSLLVFSRSTMDPYLRIVNLHDVVDEVERVIESTSTKPVSIISDELPAILGDHSQMVQLFQNLTSNAVKYNDKPEILIKVSYEPEPRGHKFTVQDNGIGIAPQYREKVFEIFKRLHNRESYSGTGIGLSICKKIVHRLNGKIWIEDSELGGVAFVFTIPKKSVNA